MGKGHSTAAWQHNFSTCVPVSNWWFRIACHSYVYVSEVPPGFGTLAAPLGICKSPADASLPL
eukprot:scaffold43699_cov17-Tisochrysis_lutea.AAC.1